VVDAGCGEGYGAELLRVALDTEVVGLDYDEITAGHVLAAYPQVRMVRANLDGFPLPELSCRAVVSLQVIEHLWNLAGFLTECRRVLIDGGALLVSTPNRPVFSPGLQRQEKPTNPFHVEEFDAAQVRGMLNHAGFAEVAVLGLHHGERLTSWEVEHGSIVAAQVQAALTGVWPGALDDFLPSLTVADFDIGAAEGAHDLIGIGRR
jgi:SAM-dependent methyltransferase